jgi:hypothetical protein
VQRPRQADQGFERGLRVAGLVAATLVHMDPGGIGQRLLRHRRLATDLDQASCKARDGCCGRGGCRGHGKESWRLLEDDTAHKGAHGILKLLACAILSGSMKKTYTDFSTSNVIQDVAAVRVAKE